MMNLNNLPAAQILDVMVSKGTATKTKRLKLCKLNSRTILFIEVDKDRRVNTFYKFPVKEVTQLSDGLDVPLIEFKNGVMPEKWESVWSIQSTPQRTPSFNYGGGAHFRT